jgi:pimeloyl-ACP methyl ester carboxylesterase
MNAATGERVNLYCETGGSGSPALLLIHGVSANGGAWSKMRPYLDCWPGRWVIVDLRGHGRSPHVLPYGFGTYAADIAGLFEQNEEVVVAGHSLGGAVGVLLGTQHFGIVVREVFAFGMKMHWSAEEITKARALAPAPVRWFDSESEAAERYLKVAGLYGIADPASAEARSGVVAQGGRYRFRSDMRANGTAGVPIVPTLASMQAPLHLAAGANDPMVSAAEIMQHDPNGRIFAGCGHNAQYERPDLVWDWICPAR